MDGDVLDASPSVWETTDLGAAAYAHLRGLAVLGVRQREEGVSDFIFSFADPTAIGRKLQIEYVNSDCRKFDEAVRTLKKLCYSTPPRRRRR